MEVVQNIFIISKMSTQVDVSDVLPKDGCWILSFFKVYTLIPEPVAKTLKVTLQCIMKISLNEGRWSKWRKCKIASNEGSLPSNLKGIPWKSHRGSDSYHTESRKRRLSISFTLFNIQSMHKLKWSLKLWTGHC